MYQKEFAKIGQSVLHCQAPLVMKLFHLFTATDPIAKRNRRVRQTEEAQRHDTAH